jgi:hypothetical protein
VSKSIVVPAEMGYICIVHFTLPDHLTKGDTPVDALKSPDTFGRALVSYHHFLTSTNSYPTVLSAQDHKEHLHLWSKKLGKRSKQDIKKQYDQIQGNSAEILVMAMVRNMLKDLDTGSEVQVVRCVPGEEVPLGQNYLFRFRSPWNCELFRETDVSRRAPEGEYDIMVVHRDDQLLLLDTTTSGWGLEQKLHHEGKFRQFRRCMQRLFSKTNGKRGYAHVNKMHVHCGVMESPAVRMKKLDGIGTVIIPTLHIVQEIAQKRLHELLDNQKWNPARKPPTGQYPQQPPSWPVEQSR